MGILGKKLDIILAEVKKLKPNTYIEIGCYRCDTMREVKKLGVKRVIGFDLFEKAPTHELPPLDGDPISFEEASKEFEVYQGDTKDTLKVLKFKKLKKPVLIFLDGGHSTETTLNDYNQVKKFGTVLIDDTTMPTVKKAVEQIREEKIDLGTSIIKIG